MTPLPPINARRPAQSGWNLLEVALLLVIAGALGMLLWNTLPLARTATQGGAANEALARAEDAVLGYAQTHFRLPAADSSANADGHASPGSNSGWLPVRTLSLPAGWRIRYEVDPALIASPMPGYITSTSLASGLDLCVALLRAQQNPGKTFGNVPFALALEYTLAAPRPDGLPNTSQTPVPLPGSPQAASLSVAGRATHALGAGEIASKLSCPARLGQATGAAISALAMADQRDLAGFYRDYRERQVKVAEQDLRYAEAGMVLANLQLVNAITGVGLGAAQLMHFISVVGRSMAAVNFVASVAALGQAIDGVVDAAKGLSSAKEGKKEADETFALSQNYYAQMSALALASETERDKILTLGLKP